MHDWWIGLVILKNGGFLLPMAQPTALYRQHGSNVIGAKEFRILERIINSLKLSRFLENQVQIFRMSKKIGAIRSLPLFALIKIYVLTKTFIKK